MIAIESAGWTWTESFVQWLTPRRLRAQAIVLALCLWGVCAVDFATFGLVDRAGNVKFQDFLPFYISARLVAQHRSTSLYDRNTQREELESIVGPRQIEIPYLYGPQVALLFVPLSKVTFPTAAGIWASVSVLIYFVCIYAVWTYCSTLQSGIPSPARSVRERWGLLLLALAFPPLFHVFVRGQISALILLCFTFAFLALQSNRLWLAGFALGFLVLKPQFLVAIPIILLFSGAWKPMVGLLLSVTGQVTFARLYFGSAMMTTYFDLVLHPLRWLNAAELSLAPIQMHSLRSFWTLLVPSPTIALALYALSSIITIVLAIAIWKSNSSPALKFSALILAAVLVNPHLFVYDLLAMAPALLLVVDWCLANRQQKMSSSALALSYLAFVLPLFGPLSRWTHVQLSVIIFGALLCALFCIGRHPDLASTKSLVV